MKTSPEPVWTRDFTLLWTANFLMAVSFYSLLPAVPSYAVKFLGAEKSQVGYTTGIFTLTAIMIRPLVGYTLDSIGRKSVFLLALGLFSLFTMTYYLASTLALMLAFRLLHGLSWGMITTGGGTVAADLVPTARRGEGLGYFGMSMTLAMAVGPMLGLKITENDQYGRLFGAASVLGALALAIAFLVVYPRVQPIKSALSLKNFFEGRVIPVAVVMFLAMTTYGGIVTFVALYSAEVGIANGGLFFLAYALAMTLFRPLAGKMMDRLGPVPVLISGLLLLMAGFLVLSASHGLLWFMASAVLLGLGNGNVMPTLQTMAVNLVEPQRRGVANSIFFSSTDLGIGIGSVALGWLADLTSLSAMYLACALILVIPLAYFHFSVANYYKVQMVKIQHG